MNGNPIDLDRNADLAASPTIKVEIYDQAYTVRSDGDPDYLKGLAEYVDQRMREISSGTLTVDSRKVAILAALYIADELHQLKKLHEQADDQLATRSVECSEMLDRLLKVPRSLDRPRLPEAGSPE
jgi:cell division protein ZapA